MLIRNKEELFESAEALNKVFQNPEIKKETLEENIKKNLVTIKCFSQKENTKNEGTGLRITTNGFILTAYHNVENFIKNYEEIKQENPPTWENFSSWYQKTKKEYFVIDQEEFIQPLDTNFFVYDERTDLAIIKYFSFKKPEPTKLYSNQKILRGEEIKLLTLIENKIKEESGVIIKENYDAMFSRKRKIKNNFLTTANTENGCSGGIFLNEKGIIGINIFESKNEKQRKNYSGGTKSQNIQVLIQKATHQMLRYDYY